jgi:hypothetical protein
MTDPEEEFLRRVADPALIEARARRRTRHRVEEVGLTDERLREREDEQFGRVTSEMWARELYERLPPGKRRKKKPIGHPGGSSVSDEALIAAAKWMTDQYDVTGRRRSDEWAAEFIRGVSAATVQRARNGRPWTYFLRFVAADQE